VCLRASPEKGHWASLDIVLSVGCLKFLMNCSLERGYPLNNSILLMASIVMNNEAAGGDRMLTHLAQWQAG
jgi:hypothetical protein